MVSQTLFVELFPLNFDRLPELTAYTVQANNAKRLDLGDLAGRLTRSFPGSWVHTGHILLTSAAVMPIQLEMTLDTLREAHPDSFAHLEAITENPRYAMTAQAVADFLVGSSVRAMDGALRERLKQFGISIRNGFVLRDYAVRPWVVGGDPVMSLTIAARIVYRKNLQDYITATADHDVRGFAVMDRTPLSMIGSVVSIDGTIGEQRETLLKTTNQDLLQRLIHSANDEDRVVHVQTPEGRIPYPASALRVLVRVDNDEDLERFQIDRAEATRALVISPEQRTEIVRAVSDVLKHEGVIGSAFNSRAQAALFDALEVAPGIALGNGCRRIYDLTRLAQDFEECGVAVVHKRFDGKPIRLGIINALDDIAADFLEAMRRRIEGAFGFMIEVVRERTVRKVSENNLSSAVRAVEKENPHLILAFFPDSPTAVDPFGEHVKSLTLAKGIASHVIHEARLHNAAAMIPVIMSVLAKTGNHPYQLADPPAIDLVVGLDLVRETLTRGDRVVAMSRIYRQNGTFEHYFIESLDLENDEPIPLVLFQTLFPEDRFTSQRVILHYAGTMPDAVRETLHRWASVIDTQFYIVELHTQDIPHLYGTEGGIHQAPWGTIFRMGPQAALVMCGIRRPGQTISPLYVRTHTNDLPIDEVLYTVLAWSLLHFGERPSVPVTILHAEDLAQWMARGMMPDERAGSVAFWL